jgi:tetratricopeptide (TPR) repeat protein
MSEKHKYIILFLIITLIVYFNSLFNQFVWDDIIYIANNTQVHHVNIPLSFSENLFNQGSHYRPIPALYFSILFQLFGNNTFFYHLIQIILHTGNGIIVFLIFKKFLKKYLSFFLTLIFLVHPINVESVSFIGGSISVLFFFFGALALLISTKDNQSPIRYLLIFLLLLLSILTKETGILFLFLIVIFQLFFIKKHIVSYIIAGIITICVYLYFRLYVGNVFLNKVDLVPIMKLTFNERLINVPKIIFFYLKTFFYPDKLAIDQQWHITSVNFSNFYAPLIFVSVFFVVLVLIGLYIWNYEVLLPLYVFFFIWFLLGLSLHLQIIPLDMTVAERWFYFPIVGILGIFGVIFQSFLMRYKYVRHAALVLAILIILVLSIRTVVRNKNWYDPITLYSHDIQTENNFRLQSNLGHELVKIGRLDEAHDHFQQSIQIAPKDFQMWESIGLIYHKKGDLKQAEIYYKKSIGLSKAQSAYENLSNLFLCKKSPQSAIDIAHKGLSSYPDSWLLWLWLSIAQYEMGREKEAFLNANKAYVLSPNNITTNVIQNIRERFPIELNCGTVQR